MTRRQFLEEIRQLPVAERVALIEAISRSVREDLRSEEARLSTNAAAREAQAQAAGRDDVPLSQRLRGVIKFDGDPPSDEEVKDIIADYLLEKYS
jgi:hypothetical protein